MFFKTIAKKLIAKIIKHLLRLTSFRHFFFLAVEKIINRKEKIQYGHHHYSFAAPNALCEYRINTFATKEPETLEWIDSFERDSVFWDIGANIGLYSIYAGKTKHCRTFAFEPSVFNLEFLARNIYLNSLQDTITIIPLALSDEVSASRFRLTTTAWGGAISTFKQEFDFTGKPF